MKKIGLFILCFFSSLLIVNAANINKEVKFKSCIDGDTANFIVNEEEIKLRFLAVNAPEKDKEHYGKETSNYVCNLLKKAKSIIIEYDEKATKDKYDRVLAWVWVDGNLLEELLVKGGYAEVAYIYDDYKYTDSLCLIQSEAITGKKGIWSSGREEDYCASIDISNVTNNIDFSLIENAEEDEEIDEATLKEAMEKMESAQKVMDGINDTTEKVSNFINNNDELISRLLLFGILGAAGIYIFTKEIKNGGK